MTVDTETETVNDETVNTEIETAEGADEQGATVSHRPPSNRLTVPAGLPSVHPTMSDGGADTSASDQRAFSALDAATPTDIAEAGNITRGHASALLRGESNPSLALSIAIVDSLNITLEQWHAYRVQRRSYAVQDPERVERMERMRDEGSTYKEIAASEGISRERVNQLIGNRVVTCGLKEAVAVAREAGVTLDELRVYIEERGR